MIQINLFYEALSNLEYSIEKILDSFDITYDYLFKESDLAQSYHEKKEELDNLKKELGEENSLVKKLRKEVIKSEASLYSSAKYKQKNIIKVSSFMYIYSIFENHNNELIKIAEKSNLKIRDKIIDNLRRLVKEKKIIDYDKIDKKIYKGELDCFSEHILRQPDLFNKFIHLFGYNETFPKQKKDIEMFKLNRNRLAQIIDLHNEIKIRRNILMHNSAENKSFNKYISQLESKHGIQNPEKRKKAVEKIWGVNNFEKLEKFERTLIPKPEYLSSSVGVLIEIMIILFYNSFSYTVNLNDFADHEKDDIDFEIKKTYLFGHLINRINCSYKTLKVFNFDNIQRLIEILLISGLSHPNKKNFYNKEQYNNGKIPWMDYINKVLYMIIMRDECARAIDIYSKIILKETNNSKIQDFKKAKNIAIDVSNKINEDINKNLDIIKNSDADDNAKGMIECFVNTDYLGFIRCFENYSKVEFESSEKIKGDYSSFDEFIIQKKEECKHSWFMFRYLVDNKNDTILAYLKT